ncbi:DUF1636 domain-containing protein [Siculibacillus lacustris]|uniref:DUF1636 domain-containing protein n=1 Tax=Siculibacillus lacustris TaxID=1549641 RepID=A0A4Q9VJ82_9HYPH|nr:DUF1636 domain-containing protein [Siculibacillus lacustris]TBW35234.1 DUF1636 domain-containing protein [Siculibacillus lacustris]
MPDDSSPRPLCPPDAPLAGGPTAILVCTNCRRDGDDPESPRAGARLAAALTAAAATRGGEAGAVRIVPVECLSVCKRPVTIGFSALGKWTYLYGDFGADTAEAILDTAALYGTAADGLIPWKTRPDAFKKGVVARIPPFLTGGGGA